MTNQRTEEIAARSRGGSFRDDTQRFHGAPTFGYVARHREEAFRLAGRVSDQADHHIHHLGVPRSVGQKPLKRPPSPFLAASSATLAASRSRQRSIQDEFCSCAKSQISIVCMPPKFIVSKRPSRSRTQIQSGLHSMSRLSNSLFSCSFFSRA